MLQRNVKTFLLVVTFRTVKKEKVRESQKVNSIKE